MFEEQLWEKDGKLQTYTNRWEDAIVEPPVPPVPPIPPLQNIIHATSETSALLFNNVAEGDYIGVEIDYDEETGDSHVILDPQGIFADEKYIVEPGLTAWDDIFADQGDIVIAMIAQPRWFPESIFETLEDVYENPTEENIDAAYDALTERIVVPSFKVSNKAFPVEIEDNPGVNMFLTPNLNNYLQISGADLDTEYPYLEYTGVGNFNIEAGFEEGLSYLTAAFDEIPDNVERAARNIWNFADLDDGDTGGTIQPECMRLVQALFDNPTEDNKDALVTYLSQFDSEYTGDPLISDDEAASIIKADLATLDAAEVLAKITAGDPFVMVINQHTYSFTVTLQDTAVAQVDIKGLVYSTPVSVEGGNIQIGEITLTGIR